MCKMGGSHISELAGEPLDVWEANRTHPTEDYSLLRACSYDNRDMWEVIAVHLEDKSMQCNLVSHYLVKQALPCIP